ncbi:MAG: CPBP family intramembrane glutamic endopeptidase [Gallionellaceae bacterium]
MLSLIIIVIAVLLATWAAWVLWRSIASGSTSSVEDFIQKQTKYQAAFLSLTLLVSVLSYAVSTQVAGQVFGIGSLNAEVHTEAFGFAHAAMSSWLQFGILLTLGFGLATYALCSSAFSAVANWPVFLRRFGGWVIAFAAVNALSEELIYRGAVVAASEGQLYPWQTALLSAVLFSIAHVRGQANGAFVVIGSAVVAWFLAQSVIQTHGLFWAWCIHFFQDVVIFAAFIANVANPALKRAPLQDEGR